MADPFKFAIGGAVQIKGGTYLPRPADDELLQACQTGEFAYVLACRQIGKSSLMNATDQKLRHSGARTAVIDLSRIGKAENADSWYFSFVDELARRLNLAVDVDAWWQEQPQLLAPTQRFLQFLGDVVLGEIDDAIVIFVDEIDVTLGLDFTDDFFAAIRSIYQDRVLNQAYHRLTFVLLGVATPDELIADTSRTPFNIGREIALSDFTLAESQKLREAVETQYPQHGSNYFTQIYTWTSGHPYLTQKLCRAVLEEARKDNPTLVDALVQKFFLSPEVRSEPNLHFVRSRVTEDVYAPEMLEIYKQVLADEARVDDDDQSPAINRLKLYGLVVAKSGKLVVRNKLYARAFDLAWAEEMLRLSSPNAKLGLPRRYKIIQELGQGGFATVYFAQFSEIPSRKMPLGYGVQETDKTQSAALKVLKPSSADDLNQVRRFKQEANAVAKLDHPNIIRIIETGGDKEPFYIVMEYVPGGTLRNKLKAGPLSREEAMAIVRPIGSALSYAHERGIIHRDVNPNNILLDTSQTPMRPVLTDFGLVKLLSPDGPSHIQSTSAMGTFDYMAPEQWRQETPTPRTDIYALALTFFEMLAGQRPFSANSSYELMSKHLDEQLPRLSSLAPEVGDFFDEALLQAAAKEPAGRFESVAQFIAALEEANAQAEEAERKAQQNQAAKTIEVARGFLYPVPLSPPSFPPTGGDEGGARGHLRQKGRSDPEKALYMIELALETYPGYLEALRLRGQIRLQGEEFEAALADYQQAYQQVGQPASDIGREYLATLEQVADTLWERQSYQEAVKHYETIWQLLAGQVDEVSPLGELRRKARTQLVEYHYNAGYMAYASGNPDHIATAIITLETSIQALESLGAESESEDLQQKHQSLEIKKYQEVINHEKTAIAEIEARNNHDRLNSEAVLQHYLTIDEAYQNLIELQPDHSQWIEARRQNLKEKAALRKQFALRAVGQPEPDYAAAIRHYKAILELEQSKYPGLAAALKLNLVEEIAELEKKADHDGKYREVVRLMERGDYIRALERLDRDFIYERNYEHRDVARLLWGLVYAKHHEGHFPPEWESMSGFQMLSKHVVQVERARLGSLKDKLEPWSQAKILETISAEHKALGAFEEEVKSIEALIKDVVAGGLGETPEIEQCRAELAVLQVQIQDRRRAFYQIDVNETAQNVEAWLQKLDQIITLVETGQPTKDIPEFFNQSDTEQQAIEADPLFKTLQTLATDNEIEQTIDWVKLDVRGQLVSLLIEDAGRKDEALVNLQNEVIQVNETSAQAEAETTRAKVALAEMQAREGALQDRLGKLAGQYEINRYLIPISLLVTVIVGGVVAQQIKNLPGLSTITAVAFVLFIAYCIYYIWVYYLSTSRNK
jgi:serine/threonine protein kinase